MRLGLTVAGAPKWSIALTALLGAWLGHFFEYARVAGWHAGLAAMTDPAHAYFLPAGAALVAAAVAAAAGAARAWARLGERLRRAATSLWVRPRQRLAVPDDPLVGRVDLLGLWGVLTVLQLCTWVVQENLEATGRGQRAPLLGVLGGVHWLAPVVQAEVALILAAGYVLMHRRFSRRQSDVRVIETRAARKWRRGSEHRPGPVPWLSAPTPLGRWGAQRWQRPPPAGVVSLFL